MRARLLSIAAILMVGTPAHGQADKPDLSKAAQEGQRPRTLVLASAEAAHSAVPAAQQQQAALSGKKIRPRVTTCRCGDPTTQADPGSQDQ